MVDGKRSAPVGGHGREFAIEPAVRYNRDMIETTVLLPLDLRETVPAPEHAPLLEQLATLRLENTPLRMENAVLQERIRDR